MSRKLADLTDAELAAYCDKIAEAGEGDRVLGVTTKVIENAAAAAEASRRGWLS